MQKWSVELVVILSLFGPFFWHLADGFDEIQMNYIYNTNIEYIWEENIYVW